MRAMVTIQLHLCLRQGPSALIWVTMRNVFHTRGLRRYAFPTHTNDLIYDRSAAVCSEAFFVVLRPGQAPPRHKHDDTEQVFYILKGRGVLTIGARAKGHSVRAGDVVLVPPGTWHSIRAVGGPMRYLAVDCFGTRKKLESTWDEHVRAMCRERGWNYAEVTGRRKAR
jgi:quercetin dioxygenase-like cupin family protein